MYKNIVDNIERIKAEIPADVVIEAVVKKRSGLEILTALNAGIEILAYNYIQQAREIDKTLKHSSMHLTRHFIGHLQKNKVASSVQLVDCIETVDSIALANSINDSCIKADKLMPVLIQVNIGRESTKNGVLPEQVFSLAQSITGLSNLELSGLMTMGPNVPAAELRPYYREARQLFEELTAHSYIRKNAVLSMGMSDSYHVAIEEGANLVRLGTAIFGPRH